MFSVLSMAVVWISKAHKVRVWTASSGRHDPCDKQKETNLHGMPITKLLLSNFQLFYGIKL